MPGIQLAGRQRIFHRGPFTWENAPASADVVELCRNGSRTGTGHLLDLLAGRSGLVRNGFRSALNQGSVGSRRKRAGPEGPVEVHLQALHQFPRQELAHEPFRVRRRRSSQSAVKNIDRMLRLFVPGRWFRSAGGKTPEATGTIQLSVVISARRDCRTEPLPLVVRLDNRCGSMAASRSCNGGSVPTRPGRRDCSPRPGPRRAGH